MPRPSAFSSVTVACCGLFLVALPGCVCGPYPEDARAFRWEKAGERDRDPSINLTVKNERYSKGSGRFAVCAMPVAMNRTTSTQIDWTVFDATDSFKHGKSETSYSYSEPTAAGSDSAPPAAAMASKPQVDIAERADKSATFRKFPVRAAWSVRSKSGLTFATGATELNAESAMDTLTIELGAEILKRIADESPVGVETVVDFTASDPMSGLRPTTRRFQGLSAASIESLDIGVQREPDYAAAPLVAAPTPDRSGGLTFTIAPSLRNHGQPAGSTPCKVTWAFGAAEAGGAQEKGELDADASGAIVIKISDAQVNRLKSRIVRKKGAMAVLSGTIKLNNGPSFDFRRAMPRSEALPDSDSESAASGSDESGSGGTSGGESGN